MLKVADLARRPDFRLANLRISPARRRVEGPGGSRSVEPQFMLVFIRLLDAAGTVVTRADLFEECWGGAVVGDDSLNRAVSGARQIARSVQSDAFEIETVPRTGYLLRLSPGVEVEKCENGGRPDEARLQSAVERAYDCWRMGLPTPDVEAIEELGSALSGEVADPRAWGMYSLLLRKAAEYAEHDDCAEYVRGCEQAARRAFALEPSQADAEVALTGVVPIFGNWSSARRRLLDVRAANPDNIPAAHDMAVLEMATGRPSAARPIIEELIARDPLAATFYYKRMYHLWTFGDLAELERIAARGLQLWPRHAAIWTARLWTLVFTGRAAHALQLLEDKAWPPPFPPPAIGFLRSICAAIAGSQSGHGADPSARERAVATAVSTASLGPAQAIAGLLSLQALNAIDKAFEVAYGYYLGRGSAAAPLRWNAGDPSITDQHRRVTQLLFIPSAAQMRRDPRFEQLCQAIGLQAYWDEFGLSPDFKRGI